MHQENKAICSRPKRSTDSKSQCAAWKVVFKKLFVSFGAEKLYNSTKMIKTNTSTSGSPKLHRKTIQRNRRIHMKSLCFKYLSSIPSNDLKPTKDMLYQQDQLDLAATYIKHLKERIQKLKGEKE
ncbi:hypothetical protein HKD37_03G007489 [Glycine soja]